MTTIELKLYEKCAGEMFTNKIVLLVEMSGREHLKCISECQFGLLELGRRPVDDVADDVIVCRIVGMIERMQSVQDGPAHPLQAVPGGLLARIVGRETFEVNSVHGQAVATLAPAWPVMKRS